MASKPALRWCKIPERTYPEPQLQQLHDAMRLADGVWRAAHAHGAPRGLVRDLCAHFCQASHAFQLARYGRVRAPVNPTGLMRGLPMR